MQKSETAQALAENVRALMKARGWSQEATAKASGVSKSAIGYLLNYHDSSSRHAALDTVDALAKAFKVRPLELLEPNGFGAVHQSGTVTKRDKRLILESATIVSRAMARSGRKVPSDIIAKAAILAYLSLKDGNPAGEVDAMALGMEFA